MKKTALFIQTFASTQRKDAMRTQKLPALIGYQIYQLINNSLLGMWRYKKRNGMLRYLLKKILCMGWKLL